MSINEFTDEMELLFGFYSRNPIKSVVKAWWTLASHSDREHVLRGLASLRESVGDNGYFPSYRDFERAVKLASRLSVSDEQRGCDYCDDGTVFYEKEGGYQLVGACALCGTGPSSLVPVNPRVKNSRWRNGGAIEGKKLVRMKNHESFVAGKYFKDVPRDTHLQDKESYRERNINRLDPEKAGAV